MKLKVSATIDSVPALVALVFAYKFAKWKPESKSTAINSKVPKIGKVDVKYKKDSPGNSKGV